MTKSVANENDKRSSNRSLVTLFDAQIMTHSVITPDNDGSTVPVKCKLTVSTRSSKLDSRVSKVETFEFRDARIEDRESRIEDRESLHFGQTGKALLK